MVSKPIDERQMMILWPMMEEFLDIDSREVGAMERDRVETFLSKIADVFDLDRSYRESQLQELRSHVNELEEILTELE
ncbi:hypothetical protein HN803_04375 [candidate division WWE3 bacterium]|jgi:hypothetical protein|nr:hypothetical protein [candidate division WWE3 bacterium]